MVDLCKRCGVVWCGSEKDNCVIVFSNWSQIAGFVQSALTSSPAGPAGPTGPSSPWQKHCHKRSGGDKLLLSSFSKYIKSTSPEVPVFLSDPANLSSLAFPLDETLRVNFHFISPHWQFISKALMSLYQPWVLRGHFVLVGQCHLESPVRHLKEINHSFITT